jgi:hypothetical protein
MLKLQRGGSCEGCAEFEMTNLVSWSREGRKGDCEGMYSTRL